MAITLADIRSAHEKFSDVRIAYDAAINAFIESLAENARYEVNPGLFAERRCKAQANEAMSCAVKFLAVYQKNVPDYIAGKQDGLTVTNHMIERALAIVGPEHRHKEFCREIGISPSPETNGMVKDDDLAKTSTVTSSLRDIQHGDIAVNAATTTST